VDQLLHESVSRVHESRGGPINPGILTVAMEGVGELSVRHGALFLGAVRNDGLVLREEDPLRSAAMAEHTLPFLTPVAARIVRALKEPVALGDVVETLFYEWSRSVARLCIGLRRLGTGGAFLLTPRPHGSLLEMYNGLPYSRLSAAVILGVLER